MKKCIVCGKELTGKQEKFCSKNCENIRHNEKRRKCEHYKNCIECKKKLINRQRKFCGGNCERRFYYKNNLEKERAKHKNWRKNNKEKIKFYDIHYKENHPWIKHLKAIKSRCNNPNKDNYKYYGARGIECLLTKENIKNLWFRDNADLMDKPNVHRINNNGNYTLENCEFIEFYEHIKKHKKE